MTYEYICTACSHEWEASQPISDAPLKKCPACKKNTAKRQISGGTGFLLKGGGWYADLYGSKPPAAKKDSDSSSKKDSDSSSKASTSTSSDSAKPAASESKGSSKETTSKPAAKTSD